MKVSRSPWSVEIEPHRHPKGRDAAPRHFRDPRGSVTAANRAPAGIAGRAPLTELIA
jgi:hypothetical protein